MTTTALLVSVLGSVITPTATADAPRGWEVTKVPNRSVTWAAPRGWKLSHQLPEGLAPSSLSIEKKSRGRSEAWLNVQALVSGNGTPQEILARRPGKLANITTQDGWTCGEESDSGADVVCARATELVTLVVEMGAASERVLSETGGIEALRKAAPLMQGLWPKGLPQPDASGNLPPAEWTESLTQDGRGAFMAPKGWTATVDPNAKPGESSPTMLSFNAGAGTGFFSITALPGLGSVSADQIPVAEERVVKFLVADAALTRAGGWTCGEGVEKSSGLPAIVCNRLTREESLYVSVRAEPAVFQTLGGVGAVRAAAERVRGIRF